MARTKTSSKKGQSAETNGVAIDHDVLTLQEAADYLRVPADEVLRMIEAQDLPGRKFGADWRFSKAAIQSWLAKPPKRGILYHAGRIKGDPYAEEMLKEIYARRGRPETEEG